MEAPRCAVLSKPGSIEQSFSAEGWRGFPIQVKAWVEFEPASPKDTAEIFLRSEASTGENTVWYRTIHATEWIEADLTHAVKDDANSIGIGFRMTGGHLSIEQISVQPAPAVAGTGPSSAEPPWRARFWYHLFHPVKYLLVVALLSMVKSRNAVIPVSRIQHRLERWNCIDPLCDSRLGRSC